MIQDYSTITGIIQLQLITTICSYQISTIQSLMQAPPPHMNAFEARNELYRQHLERVLLLCLAVRQRESAFLKFVSSGKKALQQGMDPASAALAAGVPERDPTQWNSPYAQVFALFLTLF